MSVYLSQYYGEKMKTKKVIVVPYNEQWQNAFEIISSELAAVLGELALSIEHVGSTSVAGLYIMVA